MKKIEEVNERWGEEVSIEKWKKKRQERKQAEQELLLEELAKMVDERRAELLQREREVQL